MKLNDLLKSLKLPEPVPEYKFCKERKYRFDFAWLDERVALEVEGGIYTGQAHGSITGITRDIEKYNLATAMGWRVLRIPSDKLFSVYTIELLQIIFNKKNVNELILKEVFNGTKRGRKSSLILYNPTAKRRKRRTQNMGSLFK